MRDPVMTQDGHVYESEAIQEWFRRGHRTSPVTGSELTSLTLSPEVPLRRAIEEYMALRPEIARRELNLRSDLLALRNITAALEEELQAKQRILSELGGHRQAEASSMSKQASANQQATACTLPDTGVHEASSACEAPKGGAGAVKEISWGKTQPGAQDGALPKMLAHIPTPCRDSCIPRPSNPQILADSSQASSSGPGRSTKLQELMKAMRWRGRSARRRPHSQEP